MRPAGEHAWSTRRASDAAALTCRPPPLALAALCRQFALALAGTSEDYALRRTADYERDLRSAAEATESAAARAAAQRFVARVLPRCTGLCVTESELEEAMAGREGQGGNAAAEDVTQLLSLGALARRLDFDRSRAYWFALPGRGGALKALADGRAELGQWLKRRKFHEALRKDSVKVRLKRARLPAEFVVYDMLGAGLLLSVPTPSGEAVRLSRKALATTVSSAARRRR